MPSSRFIGSYKYTEGSVQTGRLLVVIGGILPILDAYQCRRREQVCRFVAVITKIIQIWRHDWRENIGKSVKSRPKIRKNLCFHNKRHSWFIKHESYQYSQRDFSFRWSFTSRFFGKSWKNFFKFLFITEVMLFTNNKTNCWISARGFVSHFNRLFLIKIL